jgi:hypothetical protein
MSLSPQDFVAKWKRVTSRERQTVQEHFLDLCAHADQPVQRAAHLARPGA